MIDFLLRTVARWLLSLRYRVRLVGVDKIAAKGTGGILFLPNHPALIDPVILFAYLYHTFRPHAIGDRDQVDRFMIRWFAKRIGVRTIGSMAAYGSAARNEIERALDESADGLKKGENLLLWPAGQVYRSYLENLRGNSSVERILQRYPDVRVVLIRTRNLWGSSYGWASGHAPNVARVVVKGFFELLACGLIFAPRREVTIEFYEPSDLPRKADRNTINRFLETYYNENAPQAIYVPHTIWERGGVRTMPEPELPKLAATETVVPAATRAMVLEYINKLTGVANPKDSDNLARDLGMDSLARTDLILWLEREFGFPQADADAMQTVADALLAACGQFVYFKPVELKPAGRGWFAHASKEKVIMPTGDTITAVFLEQAVKSPSKIIIADQTVGAKSFRDIITACLVLKPVIERLDGDCVGIMLPASVAAEITYLATLFAGKTPVMVNWTLGQKNILESLNSAAVKRVLTSRALLQRLAMQGIDLSAINERFVFLEPLGQSISKVVKLRAWLSGYFNWGALYKAKVSNTAGILFTSGSETVPKAVPLTHNNILSNLRDVLQVITIRGDDRLIGFLPPFHSFGLTCTMLVPICGGVPTVYHPNPMEAALIGRLIEAYRVTMLIGTPTFLGGVVRASTKQQLFSLRLAVTGAEKCSEKIYAALKENCANAVILEGYGVTECSPIISLNDENDPRPFTIGKVLPSLEYLFIDPDSRAVVQSPAVGILLVRGPSVFGGYLNYRGASPFVEVNGKSWYRTGDLVGADEQGVLKFRGRLKRFVKLGGEMISLPAIEAVLEEYLVTEKDEGPVLAVEAAGGETPELVLFTIRDIDRETVNRHIRESGLSGLHNIRTLIKLDAIPTLGTGKTDYRALRQMLSK
jgi:acyl-CoA synthetase (AMP-forming)/AMP-acid ligase II/1-acyl-sn-glycerol-3-phosphate acyltransferase/acyl carrier protein